MDSLRRDAGESENADKEGDDIPRQAQRPPQKSRPKPKLSDRRAPSAETNNADEEIYDGEPEPDDEAAAPSSSKKKGKKVNETEYFLKNILDERENGLYLAEWEPNWQRLKPENDAIKGKISTWENLAST